MFKHLSRFSLLLFSAAGITYLIHHLVVTNFFPETNLDLLVFSYKFNVGFTFLFTTTIILASERLKQHLGFIFMVSGLVKPGDRKSVV